MAKIAGFFPIGDTGEQFIVAEWHPDPEILKAEIIKMANQFQNWVEPLLEAKQLMIEDTKLHFEQEREPSGKHFIPLERRYSRRKALAGYGDKTILRREDILYKAATSEAAWFVTQDAIFFNSAVLPKYGPILHEGSGKRGTTGFHRLQRTQTAEQLGNLFKENPQIRKAMLAFERSEGSGNNLPARPFIGADVKTIAAIEQVFIRHIKKTIEDQWAGMGPAIPFMPGSMTTFIPAYGGGTSLKGAGGRFIGSLPFFAA